VAVGISDVDDPEPLTVAAFLDRRRYCPACRFRVNARRAAACVMAIAVLAALVYLVVR
jgi:hypothetical protein